jgi:hypothetical protein
VAQTRLTIAAGQTKTQRVRFVPQEPGDQVGYVSTEEADDFSADNKRFFVLRVPSKLTVAVAGSPGPARDLVMLAMNPARDPDGFVQVVPLSPFELEGEDWARFDAIYIVDAGAFSGNVGARLHTFCETGKGVFVLFGPLADLRSYANWLPALGLPVPGEVWQAESNPTRWAQLDLEHPLFEGLFAEKPADISPDVRRLLRTTATSSAVPIIGTSAGLAFMWESKIGKGRALMMTSSPDPAWSSLFRSGIYPPLMVSSAAYLAGIATSGADHQFEVGVPAIMHFAGSPGDAPFELRGESARVSPAMDAGGFGYDIRIPALDQMQTAELWQGSRRVAALAVNVPGRESAIQPLDAKSYEDLVGGKIARLGTNQDTRKTILEGRFGRELWKLCLLIALGLLVAEMLISRVGKREMLPAT